MPIQQVTTLRRDRAENYENRWGDGDYESSEEEEEEESVDEPEPEEQPRKRVRLENGSASPRSSKDQSLSPRKVSPKRRNETSRQPQILTKIRQQSRYQYLEKREAERVALAAATGCG